MKDWAFFFHSLFVIIFTSGQSQKYKRGKVGWIKGGLAYIEMDWENTWVQTHNSHIELLLHASSSSSYTYASFSPLQSQMHLSGSRIRCESAKSFLVPTTLLPWPQMEKSEETFFLSISGWKWACSVFVKWIRQKGAWKGETKRERERESNLCITKPFMHRFMYKHKDMSVCLSLSLPLTNDKCTLV